MDSLSDHITQRFNVCPDIHPDDFIFAYHRDQPNRTVRDATLVYFEDGARSAGHVHDLIGQFRPASGAKPVLLDFASGYGCVTRHLLRYGCAYDIVACDIHEQALVFLREKLGVEALASDADPDRVDFGRQFDVIYALSFFSHIPDASWGKWLRCLVGALQEGGILIFTTSGRAGAASIGQDAPADFWFAPISEQGDLPGSQYGTMLVSPVYVFRQLAATGCAAPVFYQEAFWWRFQDVYVVQKARHRQPTDELARLRAEIAALRASHSWRYTQPLRDLIDTWRRR